MRTISYQQALSIEHPESLIDKALPDPIASGHDILVAVQAISVNPVDTKVRQNSQPATGEWKTLGWDAAGVVQTVGTQVTLFKPGDRVWYAGDIRRQGTNSELHLVDERIVGHMPVRLGFAEAAALPLTAITAWEMLFDRLQLLPSQAASNDSLLIIGASGGVGSIMVQLARQLTGVTVIGTASRPETQAWVRELGAHHVIDHSQPISEELKRIGIHEVSHVVSLTHTDEHFDEIVKVIAPQGKFGLIDDPKTLNVAQLKSKSVSLHWESMFTRSMFETDDRIKQHQLLNEVAALVDSGRIRTTVGEHYGGISAENLKKAHAHLESGKARGKIVLEGF